MSTKISGCSSDYDSFVHFVLYGIGEMIGSALWEHERLDGDGDPGSSLFHSWWNADPEDIS